MKESQRPVKAGPVGRHRFVAITADLLLGAGIGAMFSKMTDFALSGHATSLDDGGTIWSARGGTGLIVDVRQLPTGDRQRPLEELARNEHGHCPVVVFVPMGSAREAMWTCDRYSIVTTSDPPEEWRVALWAACRGGRHVSPPAMKLFAASRPMAPLLHGDTKTLSPREREILALTQAGHMPSQIARELGRSIKTIEAHYSRIKTKLGVKRMASLRQG